MARKCGNCKGTGLEKCPNCGGTGKITLHRDINPDATWPAKCPDCNKGKIPCRNPKCNGGWIE